MVIIIDGVARLAHGYETTKTGWAKRMLGYPPMKTVTYVNSLFGTFDYVYYHHEEVVEE